MDTPFPAYQGDQPYVFVCYAHTDSSFVYPEISWLRDQGVNIWYDEGISAGEIWRGEIARSLDGASCAIYYVSANALASDHCNREIHYALDKGCQILPVYLEEIELTPDLQIGLARVQALNRFEDSQYRQRLLAALHVPMDPNADTREVSKPKTEYSSATEPSVAVLPFANLSGDPENEYFSDGVAEEILNALANISGLKVVARTSAFSFKGRNLELAEIAQALKVDHVLEGSVRRGGDRVRVQVQLVDTRSGFGMWSNSFDGDLEDIFGVQDEIAAAVAQALRVELVDRSPIGSTTTNMDAYNVFLKGRSLLHFGDVDSMRAAIGYFKQAVGIDLDYAAAYGGLALSYALYSLYVPIADIVEDWGAAFDRALSLNPNDGNALAAKAWYVTLTEWDWGQAGELYLKAIRSGMPSAATSLYGTFFLAPLGKWQEMKSLYEETLKIDPCNLEILWDLAHFATRYDEPGFALEVWDRVLTLEPAYPAAWVGKAFAHATLGNHGATRAELEKADVGQLNPYTWQPYISTLVLIGDDDGVMRRLHELERLAEEDPSYRHSLNLSYVLLGDIDKALTGLEAASETVPFGLIYLRLVEYARLKGEPLYEELLQNMNLDDASLQSAGLL